MQMKTGVEQAIYAISILEMLPAKAVLPGEAISSRLGASPTYCHKLLRKLVNANLITSVAGVKGGFKLNKKADFITVYDIYVAIEGQQSLYSSCGILHDVLQLPTEEKKCMLTDLMLQAEDSWKNILKSETIASLVQQMRTPHYEQELQSLELWISEKMVI